MFDWVTGGLKDMVPDWAMNLLGGDDKKSSAGSTESAEQRANNISNVVSNITEIKPVQSRSISNSNQVNESSLKQDIIFNITAENPEEAGNYVNDMMQSQFATAQTQLNRGGGR